jgi:trehalose synthase-fused probable maltokinase
MNDEHVPPFHELEGEALVAFVREQRWFGAKTSDVTAVEVVDGGELRDGEEAPAIVDTLVEVRYGSGNHDLYQLILGSSYDEPAGPVIGEREGRKTYEAANDPVFVHGLIDAIGRGSMLVTPEGTIEFCGAAGRGGEPAVREVRPLGVEQSNSSIVIDDQLIVKLYRRVEPGVTPERELLHFFATHGFEHVPALWGWWSYAGALFSGSLGMVQRYVPGATDGWSLAQQELESDPEAFVGRTQRLGEVIGSMHAVLVSETDDPAFAPETASPESLALLTASVDEQIDEVFLSLPENEATAPIVGKGDAVRGLLRDLSTVGSVGKRIRHHGDLHLGQMLYVAGDWIVIDFEGEPARPLPERRLKHSPLRDVAGMLRSFTYAVRVAGVEDESVEERARAHFLDGYFAALSGTDLLPPRETTERLLRIYELEKAVYELRYELANRPDWVTVPVGGIVRLLEQADT